MLHPTIPLVEYISCFFVSNCRIQQFQQVLAKRMASYIFSECTNGTFSEQVGCEVYQTRKSNETQIRVWDSQTSGHKRVLTTRKHTEVCQLICNKVQNSEGFWKKKTLRIEILTNFTVESRMFYSTAFLDCTKWLPLDNPLLKYCVFMTSIRLQHGQC